jgi:primosomal protein N' (replication factor Y)
MIAKGLDYPDVTLVGVLNADTSMHVPDFRASERTFQLLEQVAGRAGRGPKGGRVIIQTYWPDHPAVRAVAESDPALVYATELEDRRALGYPPFGRLANVLVHGLDRASVRSTAISLAERIVAVSPAGVTLVGPAPAPIERIKGHWRWHMIVKGPPDADLAGPIVDAQDSWSHDEEVAVLVDIDPAGML